MNEEEWMRNDAEELRKGEDKNLKRKHCRFLALGERVED